MKKLYTLFITGTLMLANNAFSQCQSATSLLVDLKMENTSADSSSYNQAVLEYGTPTFTADRHGNATGALNSTSGTIFLTNDQTGNFKCQFPFTFSGWIKLNALGTRNPIFMNEDHGSSYSGAWINVLQTGEVIASYGNGGPPGSASRFSGATAAGVISAGTWYHIAVVYNSTSDIDIYVNGVSQSVNYTGSAASLYYYMISGTAGKIGSGVNGSGTNAYFNGAIDDVRFWNVALVSQQIQALYNNRVPFLEASSISLCVNEFTNVPAPALFCAYSWSNGDNTATATIYGSALGAGVHNVYINAYDNHNVLYRDSVIVTVDLCTGVDENAGVETLAVYPNPSSGSATIETATPGYFTVANVLGETLMNLQVQNKQTLNMQAFTPGIYFITELNSGKTLRLLLE